MAKVKLPTPFKELHGKLNKNSNYYYFVRNGQQYIGYRDPNRQRLQEPTPKQTGVQNNFKSAQQFAKQVKADPNRLKHYTEQWKKVIKHFSTFNGYLIHCYFAEYCGS